MKTTERNILESNTTTLPCRCVRRAVSGVIARRLLLQLDASFFGLSCAYCGQPFDLYYDRKSGLYRHFDHIIPWSKGGKTTIENLIVVCSGCNWGKGSDSLDSYLARIGHSFMVQPILDWQQLKAKRVADSYFRWRQWNGM